jgi:hypothetical protein
MWQRREQWHDQEARIPFASARNRIHRDALKIAYELGLRGTDMLHTHYSQNPRKEEALRFWGIPTDNHQRIQSMGPR